MADVPDGFQIDPNLSRQMGTLVAINPTTGARMRMNNGSDPNVVKGLIEGRIAPPNGMAASKPYWQAHLQTAAQIDPNFDMINYQARAKARADFTSGKSAQNITALNTVIGHLDGLDKAIDGLGNYRGDEPGPILGLPLGPLAHANNALAHTIAAASGTDDRIKTFETSKIAVANELTRVFRGTGGAEADIQAWQKQLDAASSPKALRTVVQQMAHLINSRVEAIGEQYKQGMGTTKDPITLLTPDKQKAFERMMGARATTSQSGGSKPSLNDIFK